MKPYISKLYASLLVLSAVSTAQADTLWGVYANADYWQYEGKADVAQTGKNKTAFVFDEKNQASLSLSIEHPIPIIPNVRLRHTALQGNDTKKVVAFEFGKFVFTQDVNLDIDLTSTDMVLYYEVLDNVISADIGIAAKLIDGDIIAKEVNGLNKKTVSIKETIPMAYLSTKAKLPLTGLSVKADVAGVSYDGSSLSDIQAEIMYNFVDNLAVDIGIKAGYRQITATLEDIEDTDADIEFKGPYLGLEMHF